MHTRIFPIVTLGVLSAVASAQPIASDRLEASMFIAGRGETPAARIPLVEERLQVTIDGQHATSTLLQVYQHGNGTQIEGQYRLRPGLGSKVEGFAYWNGEQKIVGEVFERQAARQVYQNVTSRRRDPGLLEEDGAGAFAFRVFPIQPNEKKRVELRWTKWLDRRGAVVKYRAPVTRSDAEIVISLTGAVKNLKSATHRLRVERVAGGVRLRSDGGNGNGPLELEWQVDEPAWQPSAYVHASNGKHDGWFALALAAPDAGAHAVAAKDVTIVIDRSGSMLGEPMENARKAAVDMIRRLDARDRVNVVAFSDEVDPLFKAPQPLTPDNRASAIGFVERLRDGGGTDIALALQTAISHQDKRSDRPRVVVFMTDGQSDAELAMKAAKADTGDVRLFTVGLGKDVNKPLLSRLAAQKRGRFTYIESMRDIKPEVARLAASIAKPLLVDVTVDVEGAHAVRLYPRTLPDLFALDELVISGRLRGTGTAKFIIKGTLGGKPVTFTRTVDLKRAPARPWVGRLWAQARVEHLLEEIALGATQPELQTEVLELALAYNFVTPYTAFLAIPESEIGDQRGTIEAERERKRKIMAAHRDAADIDAPADIADPGPGQDPARPGLGTTVAKVPPSPGRTYVTAVDGRYAKNVADGEEEDESVEYGAPLPADASPTSRRGRGCAGCATGESSGSLLWLGLALAALLVRRRR